MFYFFHQLLEETYEWETYYKTVEISFYFLVLFHLIASKELQIFKTCF